MKPARGFAQILIIAVIALVISAGAMYGYQKLTTKPVPSPSLQPTPQSPPQESLDMAPCDINNDGECDEADLDLLDKAMGAHRGEKKYNPIADIDADGVINNADKQTLLKLLDQRQTDET